MTLRRILLAAIAVAWAGVTSAYLVGPPLSLDKLAAEADLIFKGKAVSAAAVQDEWYKCEWEGRG